MGGSHRKDGPHPPPHRIRPGKVIMSQPQSSVLPEDSRDSQPPRARAPAVERIAGWSARHRKTAVFGWLALVAVAFAAAQLLGSPNHNLNDTGQSGRAEQTLERLGVYAPPSEGVLIQVRTPGATFAGDPAMREAARQVTAALTACHTRQPGYARRLGPAGRHWCPRDGRSAPLITFTVPGQSEQRTASGRARPAARSLGDPGPPSGPAGSRGR